MNPSRWAPAVLLLLLRAVCAQAARCPGIYGIVREEAERLYGEDLSCEDLRRVNRTLPFGPVSLAEGTWAFSGEEELREALGRGRGLTIPPGIIPVGFVERPSPEGKALLVVLGLSLPRLEGLIALVKAEEEVTRETLSKTFGRGALYDRVAVFTRPKGGAYAPEALWRETPRGGAWGSAQPEPEGLRLCLPCTGWLCPRAPVVCFSDLDDDGWEEAHLTGDCADGRCYTTILEGSKGGARKVFSGVLHEPVWKERPDGWALVPRPACRAGGDFCAQDGRSLGNPRCVRPDVYRFDRASHRLVKDGALQDEYYRISVRRLPSSCPARSREILVFDPEAGFVRYRP